MVPLSGRCGRDKDSRKDQRRREHKKRRKALRLRHKRKNQEVFRNGYVPEHRKPECNQNLRDSRDEAIVTARIPHSSSIPAAIRPSEAIMRSLSA